jgi:hypothetical protein
MYRVINRGGGKLHLERLPARAWNALVIYLTQRTTLRARPLTSLLHLLVAWGFTYYFLINALDILKGFIPGFQTTLEGAGFLFDLYRLLADVLSAAVLVGVMYLILRRFYLPARQELTFHDNVLLHPGVKAGGVRRDSLIVAFFILIHVGARFLGEAVMWPGTARTCSCPSSLASVLFGDVAHRD